MSVGFQDRPDREDCDYDEPYALGFAAFHAERITGIKAKSRWEEGTVEHIDWQGGYNTAKEEFEASEQN